MILDGAFATELEKRGCDLNDPLWSAKILLEYPEIIGEVHRDYYQAGADCVITASYQATIAGFMKRGLTEAQGLGLIQQSVAIARRARDGFWASVTDKTTRPAPLVAASIGPYGAFLADGSEYRGDYALDENALKTFHAARMSALIDAKPDVLACETIPCLKEALAVAKLLQEFPGIYGWISFSAKDGMHIKCPKRPMVSAPRLGMKKAHQSSAGVAERHRMISGKLRRGRERCGEEGRRWLTVRNASKKPRIQEPRRPATSS